MSRGPQKTTVVAPSNIAFVKYWGARDLSRAIPINPSISMTLDRCTSRSTVEWLEDEGEDEISWRPSTGGGLEEAPPAFRERIVRQLRNLRRWAEVGGRFRVATENNFPSAAGLASSASGFAALTLATLGALGREVDSAEQSALARASGSGSASRSVFGGYVEWPAEDESEDEPECHARQLEPAEHWDLRDVVAIVSDGPKEVSSLEGHRRARSSAFYATRQRALPARLAAVRTAIEERDLEILGREVEAEAIELHCMAMTSRPPVYYWQPGTLRVLEAIRGLRASGISAFSTMDAGPNVHVICAPEAEPDVVDVLKGVEGVRDLLQDRVGPGPRETGEHLF